MARRARDWLRTTGRRKTGDRLQLEKECGLGNANANGEAR